MCTDERLYRPGPPIPAVLQHGISDNQSKKYAENIRDTLQKSGLSIRKVIPGDFAVIAYTEMPAVLIECGYISNSNFERDLQKPEVLNLLAENIAKSIQNLF